MSIELHSTLLTMSGGGFLVCFVLVFAFFITVHSQLFKLLKLLRTGFPAVYKDLGEPSLFNSSIKNQARVLKFIFKKEYALLDNHQIETLGSRLRTTYKISFILVSTMFLAFFLTSYLNSIIPTY